MHAITITFLIKSFFVYTFSFVLCFSKSGAKIYIVLIVIAQLGNKCAILERLILVRSIENLSENSF
jgi:hypothetical protein